tara:strand:+ start:33 stop:1718 length:1686 start_codon:yes stop_codon:yes gene_type:complete
MNEEEPNYEEIIDDEFSFPRFSEDPTEQNRLNVRHALKKSTSGMTLTEVEQNLLIDNGLDDFVRGGQTQAAGVDAMLLAAPFLAKPAILSGALTGTANLIKKYPLKAVEVGLTGLGASDAIDNPQDLVLETLGMKTDTMFSGGKKGPFNPVANLGIKKLTEIFTEIFDGPNPKFATPEGVEVPNTFFKATSNNTSGFVPPTPKQVYDTKQKLMTNQLADASGKLNIWNYFNNKKGRSNWGRLMAKEVQTLPHTRESWTAIKKELQSDFLSIYPEKFLKTIKYKNAKGVMVPLSKDSIEVEHIFTLQQSMPIFADVEWGGELWQQISRQILSRQFALGDTRQNLVAVPEHIHRIKSQYFNKMAGIDGRKFFTDDVINQMIADPKFRTVKIDEWLDEVEKGKKIIDDGLTIWETLYKGKEIPLMPEELVEKLANIDLDTADIKKVIPQIFEEFEAEGFTTDAWNVKELKAEQLKIDRKDVEATGKIIDKYIKSNPKKYNKPYPFGMRDQDLRDAAENAWVWMRKNKLKFEGPIQQSLFDAENKEKWIKFTMKSILNQSKRNFK